MVSLWMEKQAATHESWLVTTWYHEAGGRAAGQPPVPSQQHQPQQNQPAKDTWGAVAVCVSRSDDQGQALLPSLHGGEGGGGGGGGSGLFPLVYPPAAPPDAGAAATAIAAAEAPAPPQVRSTPHCHALLVS